jgi:aspartyl-tRNA(Asn)/glutamyl-tRNA(Gln) amidotransferase subunit C
MKLSREEVLRIAELAHLGLSPQEVDTYRGQLDVILTYIDKLKELDVTSIEPMAQVLHTEKNLAAPDEHPELREDILAPCNVAAVVLAGAPDSAAPFFRVPRVVSKGDEKLSGKESQ